MEIMMVMMPTMMMRMVDMSHLLREAACKLAPSSSSHHIIPLTYPWLSLSPFIIIMIVLIVIIIITVIMKKAGT